MYLLCPLYPLRPLCAPCPLHPAPCTPCTPRIQPPAPLHPVPGFVELHQSVCSFLDRVHPVRARDALAHAQGEGCLGSCSGRGTLLLRPPAARRTSRSPIFVAHAHTCRTCVSAPSPCSFAHCTPAPLPPIARIPEDTSSVPTLALLSMPYPYVYPPLLSTPPVARSAPASSNCGKLTLSCTMQPKRSLVSHYSTPSNACTHHYQAHSQTMLSLVPYTCHHATARQCPISQPDSAQTGALYVPSRSACSAQPWVWARLAGAPACGDRSHQACPP